MVSTDRQRVLAPLERFVSGRTLAFGALREGELPGAHRVPGATGSPWDPEVVHAIPEASVENVVGLFALETCQDPATALGEWARVLVDGGEFALVWREGATEGDCCAFTMPFLVQLLHRIGGFDITAVEEVEPGKSWLVSARKLAALQVRLPFSHVGPRWGAVAAANQQVRAELHFQAGLVFLQAGDPTLAQACFQRQLAVEPRSADGLLGLGMSYASQGRWAEAITELQRVVSLEPGNQEARRWLNVAVEKAGSPAPAAGA